MLRKPANPLNSVAFFLACVSGKTLILNRNDLSVSQELMDYNEHDPYIGLLVCRLALSKRRQNGDGVVIVDGGANLGSYSVLWSKFTMGWGRVLSFEPQRWPFYALCGNIAINNCFNAEAYNRALAASTYEEMLHEYSPLAPHEFGGWSMRDKDTMPAESLRPVRCVAIDDMKLERLDVLKLDLEGYEPAALQGARLTIATQQPIIVAEHPICGHQAIIDQLPGYDCVATGTELICAHRDNQDQELKAAMHDIVEHFKAAVAQSPQ